ncbi:Imm1 family immunity protein [Streptomyces adustus]
MFLVGVRTGGQFGILSYSTGEEGALILDGKATAPVATYMLNTHPREFLEPTEVPINLVRQAVKEFVLLREPARWPLVGLALEGLRPVLPPLRCRAGLARSWPEPPRPPEAGTSRTSGRSATPPHRTAPPRRRIHRDAITPGPVEGTGREASRYCEASRPAGDPSGRHAVIAR